MKENIAILGSTGSIGTQTLEVVSEFKDLLSVTTLGVGSNIRLLSEQIQIYLPSLVSVAHAEDAKTLKLIFEDGINIEYGDFGNCQVAKHPDVTRVVVATPGLPGIKPTIEAIKAKKTIALATKEVLVAAGNVVTKEARENGVQILPVDSEHSAIFQCLQGYSVEEVSKIYLTCSGGPFRGMNTEQLKNVTVENALSHPNWKMGKKITVDSATLMNKGFEVIEAYWLFGIPIDKIAVIVHPQSVIHSMVEFVDGSIIAQMGPADMRLPIQYALLHPNVRQENPFKRLNLMDYSEFTIEEPDIKTFRCLELALESIRSGGTYSAVLNAANDIAVEKFLKNQLPFYKIPEVIEAVLEKHTPKYNPSLDDIFQADSWARRLIDKGNGLTAIDKVKRWGI